MFFFFTVYKICNESVAIKMDGILSLKSRKKNCLVLIFIEEKESGNLILAGVEELVALFNEILIQIFSKYSLGS